MVLIEIYQIYIHRVNIAFLYTALSCLMFDFIHSSGSLASTHTPEVTDLATVCTLLPISWALSQWMAGATITACLFVGTFVCADGLLRLYMGAPLVNLCLSNSLLSLRLFIMADWVLGLLLFLPSIIPSQLLSLYFPQIW